jgi:hypothetical protein
MGRKKTSKNQQLTKKEKQLRREHASLVKYLKIAFKKNERKAKKELIMNKKNFEEKVEEKVEEKTKKVKNVR